MITMSSFVSVFKKNIFNQTCIFERKIITSYNLEDISKNLKNHL